MATLDITEYKGLGKSELGGPAQAVQEPSLGNQQVTVGGVSAQSVALNGATRLVRLHTDVACRVAFGADPTAAATSMRLAADQTEYFGVEPGIKIAVISTS